MQLRLWKPLVQHNLLFILECRLDNVVYRMGFGMPRALMALVSQGDHGQR
jgi:ribosomal protein S4